MGTGPQAGFWREDDPWPWLRSSRLLGLAALGWGIFLSELHPPGYHFLIDECYFLARPFAAQPFSAIYRCIWMFLTPLERQYAHVVHRLAYANPFDRDEQAAIRRDLAEIQLDWREQADRLPPVEQTTVDPFLDRTVRDSEALLERLVARFRAGEQQPAPAEIALIEDLIVSSLHMRHLTPYIPVAAPDKQEQTGGLAKKFRAFRADLKRWTQLPVQLVEFLRRPEHAFAVYHQYRVAEYLLWTLLHGNSQPLARLRASTWRSIFPREQRWYGLFLYERMHEVTTLILGPSGTGKELIATVIGLARYVAFDPKRERFVEPYSNGFHPLNLSAMPRDLIESELFGHVAGAFTGAVKDREGWFEKCRAGHTVFLDELGELEEPLQVRLLRVLQSRDFHRVGDSEPRRFAGRVIAATNRDLGALIAAGQFRADLYYRLCSDVIHPPTLREQLDDAPEELNELVAHAARRCLGDVARPEFVDQLTQSALAWIESSPALGPNYAWPGNRRELEQCVRSVMVRGEYHPPALPLANQVVSSPTANPKSIALQQFLAEVRAGRLDHDELLTRYCSLIHSQTGNVAETARRLKKHRVTVQSRIDSQWVDRFRRD